jgi:hypothetical protein
MRKHDTLILNRRDVIRFGAGGAAAAGLGLSLAGLPGMRTAFAQDATPAADEPVVMCGDVIEYHLENEGKWAGHFGGVTFKMHAGFYDGGDAWFIRTDASDLAFSEAEGLVYVPLLANALNVEGSFQHLFVFEGGVEGQRPVMSSIPANEDFSPAFHISRVTFTGEAALLDSMAAIDEAKTAGTIAVEETGIVVNYPLISWPGGGLPVDPDLVNPMGPGMLVSEPDTAAGTVTFKLHQCYPGSRYIATDTSAVPMAGMMGVVGSAPTQKLIEAKATAPIYVFGNGVPGPAAMGFQPSIFNSKAGDVIWSPFWEHFTVVWNDPAQAVLLTSEAEVMERKEAGDVTVYAGVPETDPVSFVVNCPAPVLAVNDFDPAEFAAATPTA